ncbi:helix-turn-helix domain-containing protein [Streptacidiphilus sp. PB12-B1b]|uniref:helix-turn-helix domain-containing protein n=1 Tax=Streptacidiphilus sp. PB12-B1b TaxID=2705012 RepID=UPI0021027B5F|nr:helix-turn-helix transcriptional regulator [Streptacidiphilus sp. PB12-B1b]
MISAARMRSGLRGGECARLAGIAHPYLIQLEAGLRTPSRKVAEQLCAVIAFTVEERAELLEASLPDVGKDHPGKRKAPNSPVSHG